MDSTTRLLQAEILRTREQVNGIAKDVDDLNDDFVILNRDVENAVELAGEAVTAANTADANASAALSANEATNARVSDLEQREDERAHYLGAFETTAALQAYPTPTENDFADNYQTMTRWIYTGGAWNNTGEKIAISTAGLANTAPLMDGTATVGTSTFGSRADHVHPSDASRVPITRTINGKPLNADIEITAADIPDLPSGGGGKLYEHILTFKSEGFNISNLNNIAFRISVISDNDKEYDNNSFYEYCENHLRVIYGIGLFRNPTDIIVCGYFDTNSVSRLGYLDLHSLHFVSSVPSSYSGRAYLQSDKVINFSEE